MQKEGLNISMIADRAGVSKASVSNYLNNKQGKLSTETAERIGRVIRESSYIPSFSARRLKRAEPSRIIGIVIKDTLLQSMFTIPFYGFMMKGIGNALGKAGYDSIVIPEKDHNSEKSISYLMELSRGFVDGFIIFNIHVEDRYVQELTDYGVPFIGMGYMFDENRKNYVGTDYYSGALDATDYLISEGCRKIALATGVAESVVSRQLLRGFEEKMNASRLSIDDSLIIQGKSDMDDSIFDELLSLFQQPVKPDGIILSERYYYDLAEVARVLGFDISSTVKVVLYNYYFRMMDIGISYLDIPYEEIGAAAAGNLLSLLEGRQIQPLLFQPKLVHESGQSIMDYNISHKELEKEVSL